MKWVLIFWILMDRGGVIAVAEFSSEEKCRAAGEVIFTTPKYLVNGRYASPALGNWVCVLR